MSFREQFFAAAPEPAVEEVATPAGVVHVRAMDAGEKDRFDREHHRAKGARFRARLVAATARDAEGRPLFGREDLERLDACPVPYLEPLVDAAIRVNKLSDAEREAVEKN